MQHIRFICWSFCKKLIDNQQIFLPRSTSDQIEAAENPVVSISKKRDFSVNICSVSESFNVKGISSCQYFIKVSIPALFLRMCIPYMYCHLWQVNSLDYCNFIIYIRKMELLLIGGIISIIVKILSKGTKKNTRNRCNMYHFVV